MEAKSRTSRNDIIRHRQICLRWREGDKIRAFLHTADKRGCNEASINSPYATPPHGDVAYTIICTHVPLVLILLSKTTKT